MRRADNLMHQIAHQSDGRLSDKRIRLTTQEDREAIERHIPNGLLPTSYGIIHKFNGDTSCTELVGNIGERLHILRRNIIRRKVDIAVELMVDKTRTSLSGAYKGQARNKLRTGDEALNLSLDTYAILNEYDESRWLEKWREKSSEQILTSCLEANDNQIYRSNSLDTVERLDMRESEIAIVGFDCKSMLADIFVVGVEEETNIVTRKGETSTEIATDTTRANYSVRSFHFKFQRKSAPSIEHTNLVK